MTSMEMNQITGVIKQRNFIYFYSLIIEVCNCQNLNNQSKLVGGSQMQQMRFKADSVSPAGTCLVLLDLRQSSVNPLNQDRALADHSPFQRN